MRLPRLHTQVFANASIAAISTAVALCTILPQRWDGEGWFAANDPDAYEYVKMVEGRPAQAPFCYRPLVPFIGSLIPLSAKTSLLLANYAFAFLVALALLALSDSVGVSVAAKTLAFASLVCSVAYLRMLQAPFMTDSAGLFFLSMMLLCAVKEWWVAFVICSCLGILARESCLILLPLAFFSRKAGLILTTCILAVLSYELPRVILVPEGIFAPRHQYGLSSVAIAYLTWGHLWVLSIAGLILTNSDRLLFRPLVVVAYAFCILGALYSSCIATGQCRMFTLLMPVMAVALSTLFDVLLKRNRLVAVAIFVVQIAGVLLMTPTHFTRNVASSVSLQKDFLLQMKWGVIAHQTLGFVVILFALALIRNEIRLMVKWQKAKQRLSHWRWQGVED